MNEKMMMGSFFDRLIRASMEEDSDTQGEMTESEYIASVARDLEMLLNTRNTRQRVNPRHRYDGSSDALDHGEARASRGLIDSSILNYGLPDFSALSLANSEHCATLVGSILTAIDTFEPRLRDVKVDLIENRRRHAPLEFVVRATLEVGELSTRLDFSASLEPMMRRFEVKPAG